MKKSELKLISILNIYEANLPKQSKKQLVKFVNEATESQLKAFILDQEIISKPDSITEQIINDRFLIKEGALKSIFGMVLFSPGLWAMYRAVRAAASENSRKCGAFAIGKVRDMCLLKSKSQEANKMINILKKSMSLCNKSKNPQKCQKDAQAQIQKWVIKKQKAENKIKNYASKSAMKGLKAQRGIKKAKDDRAKVI